MLDQLAGRPSPSWRRSQVSLPAVLSAEPAPPAIALPLDRPVPGCTHRGNEGTGPRDRANLLVHAGLARAPVLALAVLPLAVSRPSGPLAPPLEPPPRPQVHAVADHPCYLHLVLRSQARRRPPRVAGTRTARTALLERLLPVRPSLPFPSLARASLPPIDPRGRHHQIELTSANTPACSATWIVTALDAGFATAMSIRWKWLRDIASLAFSGYYLLFANEADEKVSQQPSKHSVLPARCSTDARKNSTRTHMADSMNTERPPPPESRSSANSAPFAPSRCSARHGRSKGTLTSASSPVLADPGSPSARNSSSRDPRGASTGQSRHIWNMLEVTFPARDVSRAASHLVTRDAPLTNPNSRLRSKPLTLHLFFAGTEAELEASHELVMDNPGGGFICMNPLHHEERLLRWAIRTKRVVISFDYGKVSPVVLSIVVACCSRGQPPLAVLYMSQFAALPGSLHPPPPRIRRLPSTPIPSPSTRCTTPTRSCIRPKVAASV